MTDKTLMSLLVALALPCGCSAKVEVSSFPSTNAPPPSVRLAAEVMAAVERDKDVYFDDGAFWACVAMAGHAVTNFGELRMWAHIEKSNAIKAQAQINATITNK